MCSDSISVTVGTYDVFIYAITLANSTYLVEYTLLHGWLHDEMSYKMLTVLVYALIYPSVASNILINSSQKNDETDVDDKTMAAVFVARRKNSRRLISYKLSAQNTPHCAESSPPTTRSRVLGWKVVRYANESVNSCSLNNVSLTKWPWLRIKATRVTCCHSLMVGLLDHLRISMHILSLYNLVFIIQC